MFETTTAKTQTDVSNKNPTHTLKQKTWIFLFTINYLQWALSERNLDVKNHFASITSFQSKIQRALSFRDDVIYEQVPAF